MSFSNLQIDAIQTRRLANGGGLVWFQGAPHLVADIARTIIIAINDHDHSVTKGNVVS